MIYIIGKVYYYSQAQIKDFSRHSKKYIVLLLEFVNNNILIVLVHSSWGTAYTSVCIVVCRQIEFKFGQNHFFKKCEDRGARGATILPLKVPMSRRTFVEKKLKKIHLYPGYTSSEVCQKHLKMTSFWLSNFVFLLGSQVDLCKLFYEVCFAHNGLVYWWT